MRIGAEPREYFAIDAGGKLTVSESFLAPIEQHFNYDYFSGIEAAFDIRRSVGDRVVSIKYKGEELSNDKRLTLCLNNYRASGAAATAFTANAKPCASCPRKLRN